VLLGQYEQRGDCLRPGAAPESALPHDVVPVRPYEAYYAIGDYTNVRVLADITIANTPYVEEAYYWKGMAYAAEGDTSSAWKTSTRAALQPQFLPRAGPQKRRSKPGPSPFALTP